MIGRGGMSCDLRAVVAEGVRTFGIVGLILVAVAGGGCSGSRLPATIPVRGVVTINGRPLAGGTVMFTPAVTGNGRVAQGVIGKDGAFTLSSFRPDDGVIAGVYAVAVTSTIKGTEPIERDRGTGFGGKSAIPIRYTDPTTSGLAVTVAGPREVVSLELTDP
jgi:hypothetical protein